MYLRRTRRHPLAIGCPRVKVACEKASHGGLGGLCALLKFHWMRRYTKREVFRVSSAENTTGDRGTCLRQLSMMTGGGRVHLHAAAALRNGR